VINKFHDFDDKFEKKYNTCPFINFLNVIAADLNVYTCQDKAYTESGTLGSISDISLNELWASETYRANMTGINPSRDCLHHCVSHGKNLALHDYLTTDKHHLEFV
jgi:sulfatase maturation enzyme AslB (radical SAM superfamily)